MILLALLFALPPDLDAYIAKARAEAGVPGLAIAVVRDGKVVAAKGYGVRRLGSPELVDEHTAFDIASLTKSFTASAVATLVDEGKMRWDDPARRHLPELEFSDAARTHGVTMRDLLSHRVGVESANSISRFGGVDVMDVIRRLRHHDEREPFRGGMVYTNALYAAAGEAAGRVAGTSWAELVNARLLAPLGMRESKAGVPHDGVANHASPHATIDGKQQPIRNRPAPSIAPAGFIRTTASDMTRWLLFHLGDGTWEGKRIVSAAAMNEMHSPQIIIPTTPEFRAGRGVRFFGGYGLGWQIMDYRGRPMLWHSGAADGMPSYMAILPEEKIGVAVFVNTWDVLTMHGAVAGRILDTLLGEPLKDNVAEAVAGHKRNVQRTLDAQRELQTARLENTAPSRPLDAYAGTYHDPLWGDIVITHADGRLSMKFGGGERADVEHWHHDTFHVLWHDPLYREYFSTFAAFGLDARAIPTRLDMRVGRDEVEARRRAP